MRLSPNFFKSTCTVAVFQALQNSPWHKDKFAIFVIVGKTMCRTSLSKVVAMVSNSHDLLCISIIIFLTWLSVIGENDLILGMSDSCA